MTIQDFKALNEKLKHKPGHIQARNNEQLRAKIDALLDEAAAAAATREIFARHARTVRDRRRRARARASR